MRRAWLGRGGVRCGAAAVAVVALVGACDSGSETPLDGGAGTPSSGGSPPSAGSETGGSSNEGGKATGGGDLGGANGGLSSGGSANGGVPVAGHDSGSGGDDVVGRAGEGGMATGSEGGVANGAAGEAGRGGDASSQAGASGASGAAGDDGQGGGGDVGCGGQSLAWAPRASNVMFLVDRSGSMFDGNPEPWSTVREAALPAIDAYDGLENIGFLPMAGALGQCPLFTEIPPAPANYSSIAAAYGALGQPTKGEGPFMLALSRAEDLLATAPSGDSFVIMVLNGAPDFCSDGDDLCPIDSVVARIQQLKAAGITTLVAGLPTPQVANAAVHAAALQSYANAGVGLPAASVGGSPADLYFRCEDVSPWKAELTASGKPAEQALGTYSESPGSAPFTSLNPANAGSLTSALSQLFARAQSCSFEAKNGKVVLASAASGLVRMGNVTVPYDASNGWHMKSDSVLELVGSACDSLRATPAATVSIDFPCSAVAN